MVQKNVFMTTRQTKYLKKVWFISSLSGEFEIYGLVCFTVQMFYLAYINKLIFFINHFLESQKKVCKHHITPPLSYKIFSFVSIVYLSCRSP